MRVKLLNEAKMQNQSEQAITIPYIYNSLAEKWLPNTYTWAMMHTTSEKIITDPRSYIWEPVDA